MAKYEIFCVVALTFLVVVNCFPAVEDVPRSSVVPRQRYPSNHPSSLGKFVFSGSKSDSAAEAHHGKVFSSSSSSASSGVVSLDVGHEGHHHDLPHHHDHSHNLGETLKGLFHHE